jgi:hypothetical protein
MKQQNKPQPPQSPNPNKWQPQQPQQKPQQKPQTTPEKKW